jgi:hypothetical protein
MPLLLKSIKYEILVKEDSTIALRDGVATSVLKKGKRSVENCCEP